MWPYDLSISLHVRKMKKNRILGKLCCSLLWGLSKKLFKEMALTRFLAWKTEGERLHVLLLHRNKCKNIREVDYNLFCDHTTSQSRYKSGKWRKTGFLQNDAWMSIRNFHHFLTFCNIARDFFRLEKKQGETHPIFTPFRLQVVVSLYFKKI